MTSSLKGLQSRAPHRALAARCQRRTDQSKPLEWDLCVASKA